MQNFSSLPTCFQISCMEVHYLLTAAQGRLHKMNGLPKSWKGIEQEMTGKCTGLKAWLLPNEYNCV